MIQIKTVSVTGFEGAIRGMRLPMQSEGDSGVCCGEPGNKLRCENCSVWKEWHERWELGDTVDPDGPNGFECAMESATRNFVIGPKDLELALKLAKAGPDHGKFLRMIHVQALITSPQYFIAELATYKVGTVMNSSSLQHKGASRDFTPEDFSIDEYPDDMKGTKDAFTFTEIWKETLDYGVNKMRRKYKETGDYGYFRLMRQLIPMSYNYTVMWDANYQTLRTIYHQRRRHPLAEWSGSEGFCEWVKTLPHSELVTEV